MFNFLIILLAAGLLAGLLYCEKRGSLRAKLAVKTVLSSLFIFAVLVQPHRVFSYYLFLLIGLIFCLGGDIFLALPQEKMFTFGLFSFLLGHIFYVTGFFYVAQMNFWTVVGLALSLIISGGVFLWLRPHLGSFRIAVIFYIFVITFMVIGAWSVMGDAKLWLTGRITVFIGALSFYFSDVFVARNRFVKAEFRNRLIGLPLYYLGQFLLAFSVGLMRQIEP